MPGARVDAGPGGVVDQDEQAGRDPVQTAREDHVVRLAQDVRRRMPGRGQRADEGAVVAHGDRRLDPVAHHIAHHQQGPAAGQRQTVEPVPAHQDTRAGGQVAGGHFEIAVRERGLGQQRLLQFEGHPLLPGEPLRLGEAGGRPLGQGPGHDDVLAPEGRRVPGTHQGEGADRPVLGDQGDHDTRVDARIPVRGDPVCARCRPAEGLVGGEVAQPRLAALQALPDRRAGLVVHVLPGRAERPHPRRKIPYGGHRDPQQPQGPAVGQLPARPLLRDQLHARGVGQPGHQELGQLTTGGVQIEGGADPHRGGVQ